MPPQPIGYRMQTRIEGMEHALDFYEQILWDFMSTCPRFSWAAFLRIKRFLYIFMYTWRLQNLLSTRLQAMR